MKIAFIYPDFESLGIEYLMAVCRRDGHEAQLISYLAEDLFFNRVRTDVPFDDIADQAIRSSVQVCAFSCVTENYQMQLACARALKKKAPHIVTIFGGVHPTAVPHRVLANPEVDCVAIGEAEVSFADLLEAGLVSSGRFTFPDVPVPGIVFKKSGRLVGDVVEGPLADLDSLPFPAKEDFAEKEPKVFHEYQIMTSRGCPYKCSYCFNSQMFGLCGKVLLRQRSVENVIAELKRVKERHSLKYVMFVDDSFTTNTQWVMEFCRRYKDEICLPFSCIANPFYLNKEKASALRSAGCVAVQIGVQSLSEDICETILLRKSDTGKIAQVLDDMRELGIMVQVDHMLGIPGERIEQQEESIRFYNEHRPGSILVFWLTYYPKTEIVEMMRRRGLISDEDLEKLEEGYRDAGDSYLLSGKAVDPSPFYSTAFLLAWLPIFPRFFVRFLIDSRFYRLLQVKSHLFNVAFPRAIIALTDARDIRGRSHVFRFLKGGTK